MGRGWIGCRASVQERLELLATAIPGALQDVVNALAKNYR